MRFLQILVVFLWSCGAPISYWFLIIYVLFAGRFVLDVKFSLPWFFVAFSSITYNLQKKNANSIIWVALTWSALRIILFYFIFIFLSGFVLFLFAFVSPLFYQEIRRKFILWPASSKSQKMRPIALSKPKHF